MKERADCRVVVIGGGLVGALLAAVLAVRLPRWRIVLVDRQLPQPPVEPGYDSRVIALGEQGRAQLQEVGVWPELRMHACAYRRMVVWDGEGTGRVCFDAARLQLADLGHVLENGRVVAALWRKLATLPNVERIAPAEITAVHPASEESPAVVEFQGRSPLTTELVCAVDGARSAVREQLGIATRSWSCGQIALAGTVRTALEHDDSCWQRFAESGPLALLPLTDGHGDRNHCSFVWSVDDTLAGELQALAEPELCRRLTLASEAVLGNVEAVEGVLAFPLHQSETRDYTRPGIALVGDAAHTIHPLAGQGANLGFADVAALAVELQRADRRGLAAGEQTVLQRYRRQRRPDNLAMLGAMELFRRLFGTESAELRWLRNRAMRFVDRRPQLQKLFVMRARHVDTPPITGAES